MAGRGESLGFPAASNFLSRTIRCGSTWWTGHWLSRNGESSPSPSVQRVRDQRAVGLEVREVVGKPGGERVGEQLHHLQSPLELGILKQRARRGIERGLPQNVVPESAAQEIDPPEFPGGGQILIEIVRGDPVEVGERGDLLALLKPPTSSVRTSPSSTS